MKNNRGIFVLCHPVSSANQTEGDRPLNARISSVNTGKAEREIGLPSLARVPDFAMVVSRTHARMRRRSRSPAARLCPSRSRPSVGAPTGEKCMPRGLDGGSRAARVASTNHACPLRRTCKHD